MPTDHADDLVPFGNVRVIKSTAPALLCRIGERNVWLPRGHIRGRLLARGDRGELFIRRWVAEDRHLFDLGSLPIRLRPLPLLPPCLPPLLHLARREEKTPHAK